MTTPHPGVPAHQFHAMYAAGPPPWDIGVPQPSIVELVEQGLVRGSVLDVGCGTGENALLLAERGHEVLGVDLVPSAIELAREKAQRRGLVARFDVLDALELPTLGRRFDTLVDSGVFHVFSDADRPRVAAGMAQVLAPGGSLHLIVFSEHQPGEDGPRRVTQAELRATFAEGWRVEDIRETRYLTRNHEGGARAWHAHFVCA